jgi:ABC-type multidrug transport system ATPase subunit
VTEAVSFSSVDRSFGNIRAVRDLTFDVPFGAITVLLGPNGAGKTTSLRLATGALGCDSGTVRALGLDPSLNGTEVRRRCGIIPPKPAFYEQLTGLENLAFAAQIFEVSNEAVIHAAERFGIRDALGQEVGGYSTGMRTRLALARAVLHDPELLLLDEPSAGLDPESSKTVLEFIRELAATGRAIMMCTHLLHEAEGIADQVVLMNRGAVLAKGRPADLTARFMPDPVVVFEAENHAALESLRHREDVLQVDGDGSVRVTLDRIEKLPDIVAELAGAGARLTRVEPLVPSLEDLYFEMQKTGKEE